MTDDDYMQFFTSCEMIDTGQVSPAVPECHRDSLESWLNSSPVLPCWGKLPAAGGKLSRAPRGAWHAAAPGLLLRVAWALGRSGRGRGMAGEWAREKGRMRNPPNKSACDWWIRDARKVYTCTRRGGKDVHKLPPWQMQARNREERTINQW